MVVGDRLWLFSQTPSGPTPLQSMMLNASPPMPIPSAVVHPSLRNFPANAANSSLMDTARNAMLARGQQINNYGMPTTKPFSTFGTAAAASPFGSRFLPPNQSSAAPSVAAGHSSFKPYDTFMPSNKYQPMKPSILYPKFGNGSISNFYKPPDGDAYLHMKYSPTAGISAFDATAPPCTNGIAELERAFGDRNQLLIDAAGTCSVNKNDKLNIQMKMESKDDDDDDEADIDRSSDIDCEEIDENDI